ncbi:MAG: hypothetical protein ACLVL2_12965 [Bacteroides cellulosilyticus]
MSPYKALVVPGARLMPADVLEKLLRLADEGATIVFLEQYPEDVPGLNTLEGRRTEFNKALAQIKEREGKGHILLEQIMLGILAATDAVPEEMKNNFRLSSIRRSHPEGHHYFHLCFENRRYRKLDTFGCAGTFGNAL